MSATQSSPTLNMRPPASLYQLLDPEYLADPYALYRVLREHAPVHWDRYLHAWVVTSYDEVATVLSRFSADRTASPEKLSTLGLAELTPIASVMTRQMLFLDAPAHTRLRSLSSQAFTPARVERLRASIQNVIDELLDEAESRGRFDIIEDLAEPLPAIVTAKLLGVDSNDHRKLKNWSATFAEVLGNFQHNPDRALRMLQSLEEMTTYFQSAIHNSEQKEGLIHDLLQARDNGDRLTEEEVIANVIVTMVGGMETTTNLIGNGVLALLRHPAQMQLLRENPQYLASAIEELLRFEPPSQHTARIAPEDCLLGGQSITKGQAVIAVMAAANRDPLKFPMPDTLDITRRENKHLAFGGGRHFCFGAPLARMEGQLAFAALLKRYAVIERVQEPLLWRNNLGLRGLLTLGVHVQRA